MARKRTSDDHRLMNATTQVSTLFVLLFALLVISGLTMFPSWVMDNGKERSPLKHVSITTCECLIDYTDQDVIMENMRASMIKDRFK